MGNQSPCPYAEVSNAWDMDASSWTHHQNRSGAERFDSAPALRPQPQPWLFFLILHTHASNFSDLFFFSEGSGGFSVSKRFALFVQNGDIMDLFWDNV